MRYLELRIPPPLIATGIALAMWWVAPLTPVVLPAWSQYLALGLVAVGLVFDFLGLVLFMRHKTSIHPLRPERTSKLVSGGVYRITRNPMYVGMLLLLCAWVLYLQSYLTALGPVLLVLYLNRFQIRPEEKILHAKFGDDYRAYQKRVRRWL